MSVGDRVRLLHPPTGYGNEGVVLAVGGCPSPKCQFETCIEVQIPSKRTEGTFASVNLPPEVIERID